MSDQHRSLPASPSLRFLKLEAKRRLAAGEFAALHEAQLAIAREHGAPSWAKLKDRIGGQGRQDGFARRHVRWLLTRFESADAAGWVGPGREELHEHFEDRFLGLVDVDRLTSALASRSAQLRQQLVVQDESPLQLRAQAGGMQIEAWAAAQSPHLLSMLHVFPVGARIADSRAAAPTTRRAGEVPDAVERIADTAFAELSLPALALAAGSVAAAAWAAARGWADLDRGTLLEPDHQLPAYSVTKLVTATTVLRLAADGLLGLDQTANEHLRTIRLADDAITVRDLLAHTGGVDNPRPTFAEVVPDLVELCGPVLSCSAARGTFSYSNGGYAALGQLIADVTGSPYARVAADLVLEPLGMTGSSYPASWPAGPSAATGYQLAADGVLELAQARVCTMPAAGGLWTTAPDLVRFGLGWSSLLPGELAAQALRPHAASTPGVHMGLGWILNQSADVAGHPGGGPGGAASLIVRVGAGQAYVTMTNRSVPAEAVNARLARALS